MGLILCGLFAVPLSAKLKVGIDVDIANDDIKSNLKPGLAARLNSTRQIYNLSLAKMLSVANAFEFSNFQEDEIKATRTGRSECNNALVVGEIAIRQAQVRPFYRRCMIEDQEPLHVISRVAAPAVRKVSLKQDMRLRGRQENGGPSTEIGTEVQIILVS